MVSKRTVSSLRLMTDEHFLVSKDTIVSLGLLIGEHVLVSKWTILSFRLWLVSTFWWESIQFNHSD